MQRLLVWEGLDSWRSEVASVRLESDGVRATGTQVGVDPIPYRLDYALDAPENFVTQSLRVEVTGEGWARRIRLVHDGRGAWQCEVEKEGRIELPPPGGDTEPIEGALDCDLALSPLTNLMPIRRHALHERPSRMDFLMAWISVPDLGLNASQQHYEHVRRDADKSIVRYGVPPGYELEVDDDGLVLVYPELARRISP